MNFPFGINDKLMVLGVPIFKQIRVLPLMWSSQAAEVIDSCKGKDMLCPRKIIPEIFSLTLPYLVGNEQRQAFLMKCHIICHKDLHKMEYLVIIRPQLFKTNDVVS